MLDKSLLTRVTRDISDGLLVLDTHGVVQFINPAAEKLLAAPKLKVGKSYASCMMSRHPENDLFHQFLLDAVYDKQNSHEGELSYVRRDGTKVRFRVTSSYLFNDDNTEKCGVVIQFSDVTEISELKQKYSDSVRVFVLMMGAICTWVFAYALWDLTGRIVGSSIVTVIIEVFGFLLFFFLSKYTSITLNEMGLSTKGAGKYLLMDGIFTAVVTIGMIIVKMVLLRNRPEMFMENKLFNWALFDWSCYIYPITVVVQEFLTRGVVHESVKRILPGRKAEFVAIVISSLFFGALHIHKGLAYMCGAVLLLSVFGFVYKRQKCIWGLCIPHFVLGTLITILFEIV